MPQRVARRTLPQKPLVPELPPTAFPDRRFRVPGTDLEIRPLAPPSIEIPANEDEDFLRRFEAWHLRTNGSLPEYICYEFLVFEKKQKEGVDFVFQHPLLGGRTEFGGFVLDFLFPSKNLGWRVQGERYHLLQAADRGRDLVARTLLESRGIEVIDLFEDDLLTRRDLVLRLAWEGRQLQGRALS
jgi:hypothetical protein